MRPRLLDLFCGAGGAAEGYHRAGFDVVGVDIEPQPRYPFEFIQADALLVLTDCGDSLSHHYDVIHASPPCQSESDLRHRTGGSYEDVLSSTLRLLARQTMPWVVENVDSTRQLPGALILCGSEFGLGATTRDGVRRTLRRHRRFGSNTFLFGAGGCNCAGKPIIGVYGNGGGGQMTRGYKGTLIESREAMQMPWADQRGVSQAIPPAYTEFIGEQLLAALEAAA